MLTDTITFDINCNLRRLQFSGLSFWLEAQNGIASVLTITSITYGTAFPDPTQQIPDQCTFQFRERRVCWVHVGECPIMGSTVADPTTQPANWARQLLGMPT